MHKIHVIYAYDFKEVGEGFMGRGIDVLKVRCVFFLLFPSVHMFVINNSLMSSLCFSEDLREQLAHRYSLH